MAGTRVMKVVMKYILFYLFTYRIYIDTHLQPKSGPVNMLYIEGDVLKGCLHNRDFLKSFKIDSNHNCCLLT